MTEPFNLSPLIEALTDAVAALPMAACAQPDPRMRRECHETVLLLTHVRERVLALQRIWAQRGEV